MNNRLKILMTREKSKIVALTKSINLVEKQLGCRSVEEEKHKDHKLKEFRRFTGERRELQLRQKVQFNKCVNQLALKEAVQQNMFKKRAIKLSMNQDWELMKQELKRRRNDQAIENLKNMYKSKVIQLSAQRSVHRVKEEKRGLNVSECKRRQREVIRSERETSRMMQYSQTVEQMIRQNIDLVDHLKKNYDGLHRKIDFKRQEGLHNIDSKLFRSYETERVSSTSMILDESFFRSNSVEYENVIGESGRRVAENSNRVREEMHKPQEIKLEVESIQESQTERAGADDQGQRVQIPPLPKLKKYREVVGIREIRYPEIEEFLPRLKTREEGLYEEINSLNN